MTVHNYRSRQVHETLNGVNPSSGFRDMRSAKSGPNLYQIWQVFGPWASPFGANGQMTMTVHNYRPRQFYRTSNGENPSSGYRDMGSASLAAARPPARPPGPWRQYPSSPEGWGVKRCDRRTDRRTDGRTDGQPEKIMPRAPKGGGIKKSGKLERTADWGTDGRTDRQTTDIATA